MAPETYFLTLSTYCVVLRLDTSGQVSLVAGNGTSGFTGDGGPATLAQLSRPTAVAVDASGNVYIEDAGNNRIRMVSNGVITTVAGGGTGDDGPATNAHLNFQDRGPGLTLDRAGNIYFADLSSASFTRIRKVSNGIITSVAGGGFSLSDNIPATTAFIDVEGVAVDSAGNIYFADFCAERIRKVSNGTITSVAGNGQENFFSCALGASGPDTGKATSVTLDTPRAVAVDAGGNIYFTEGGAGPFRVRKVSNGNISTVAGGNSGLLSGPARGDGISATSATLELAAYNTIAIDAAGNLYIPDENWVTPPPGGVYHGDIQSAPELGRLRKVSNGVITTLAGSTSDGGFATGAQLNLPAGVAVDDNGNLFIADGNGIVRQVSNGIINTNRRSTRLHQPGIRPPGLHLQRQSVGRTNSARWGHVHAVDPNPAILFVVHDGIAALDRSTSPSDSARRQRQRRSDGYPNQNPAKIAHLVVAGQTVTVAEGPAPGFGPVISSVMTAGGESSTISPNTWLEIKGPSLGLPESRVWQNSDFVSGQMPVLLDGISVWMNGESAYVYYIGPNQIDVLTPPDLASGPLQVMDTVATVSSPTFVSRAQPISPSFFVFSSGPYVAAAHADGSLLGPAGLYPGSTPAKPGETILLFANGFGLVTPPVSKGSGSQAGNLPALPAITIGGATAAVSFAGLVEPGEFQFNVEVPFGLATGDQAILATYGGQTTQVGTLITVQN